MRYYIFGLILQFLLMPTLLGAQELRLLKLPNQEQLSSGKVLFLLQDSEGILWYATEGGGLCRDDGLQIDIFRSDADNPELLGSNNISCLAEFGQSIIIGTFHGAYALNRKSFNIQRIHEVDDKRIDDILVTTNGQLLIAVNKKILAFNNQLQLEATYPSRFQKRDVYVNHLYEDSRHTIWATQWNGGLIRKDENSDVFLQAEWSHSSVPTDLAEDPKTKDLWVGTMGHGIVRYNPTDGTIKSQAETGNAICVDMLMSKDGSMLWMITTNNLLLFQVGEQLKSISTSQLLSEGQKVLNRLSLDLQGTLLVAGSEPGPFAIATKERHSWYDGTIADGDVSWNFHERQGLIRKDIATSQEETIHSPLLHSSFVITKQKDAQGIWIADGMQLLSCTKDTIMTVATLPVQPVTFTDDGKGHLWLSTGRDIHRFSLLTLQEDSVMENIKDVSALTVTTDGTLWMGTIFGKILSHKNGKLSEDEYASNECNDGIVALTTDSCEHLVIASDKYVRLYDIQRHTLRQQTRGTENSYTIELQETAPYAHWSHPERETVIERLPEWITSWWMWCLYILFFVFIVSLIIYNYILRKQRRKFLEEMRNFDTTNDIVSENETDEETASADDHHGQDSPQENELLKKAIAQVEKNLSNERYSVEELSSDLCMSRMTFYRKIQSLTGQKPTEFIRTIRLRRAAEMLKQGEKTVTEISYATGFSSVSYFSRCFRTMFGVPPTQFGKNITLD